MHVPPRSQKGRSHMLLVSTKPGEKHINGKDVLGVITLEDVIEEILGEEICDEDDVWESNAQDTKATVVRTPLKRAGTAVGLGAVMAGVVERRKQHTADYGAAGPSAAAITTTKMAGTVRSRSKARAVPDARLTGEPSEQEPLLAKQGK